MFHISEPHTSAMAGAKTNEKKRKMYSLCSFRQSNIVGVSKQQYFQVFPSIHVLCGKCTSTGMALVPVDSAMLLSTETHESHGHFLVIDFEGKKKEQATFAERLVWKGQVFGGNERERTNVAFVEIDSALRDASERTPQRKGPVNSYFI